MMKNESNLNKYHRKGKFLRPPLSTISNLKENSWINERMPEMLWVILILNQLERNAAIKYFRYVLSIIKINHGFFNVTHTGISKLEINERIEFLDLLTKYEDADIKSILRPLLLYTNLPASADWKTVIRLETNVDSDWDAVANAIAKCLSHQSQEATDVRWFKIASLMVADKIRFNDDIIPLILNYPDEGDMRMVRPTIRATEVTPLPMIPKSNWPQLFWDESLENTNCFPENSKDEYDLLNEDQLNAEKKHYDNQLNEAWKQLISDYFETLETTGINSKHDSIFGIAFYSLNILIETIIYRTSRSINGRLMLRTIFESYITLRYLIQKENTEPKVWDDYRSYGSGQANLIYRKYEENNLNTKVFNIKKIEAIANEDKWVEFIPINLGHWDNTNLRVMSEAVGEKSLYNEYFDYISSIAHGSWNAVREFEFQKCMNPLHRLHIIPSFELPVLPSVLIDLIKLTNNILEIVNKEYPLTKLIQIELQSDKKE